MSLVQFTITQNALSFLVVHRGVCVSVNVVQGCVCMGACVYVHVCVSGCGFKGFYKKLYCDEVI